MSSSAKSLMDQVKFGGKMMAVLDVLTLLHQLPPQAAMTTSEAAIFLRSSVTSLERMRKAGNGPRYIQGGSYGAKGTNQSCSYTREDLIAWQHANTVSNSIQAAAKKGQTFATIFDLAEHEAFYIDAKGNVESMVEENLLSTVIDRLGEWDILWMTPVEAASRRWTDLSKHQEFAAGVQSVLSKALHGVQAGIDATDIAESAKEPTNNAG
jgi:hypothetical protein